jgi:hypothetical protein
VPLTSTCCMAGPERLAGDDEPQPVSSDTAVPDEAASKKATHTLIR